MHDFICHSGKHILEQTMCAKELWIEQGIKEKHSTFLFFGAMVYNLSSLK